MRGISSVFQLAVGTSATHETGGGFDDEEKAKQIMSHWRWMLVVTSGPKFASLWGTDLLLEEINSHLVAAAKILCKEFPALTNNGDEWRKRALEMINETGEKAEARLLARKLNEIPALSPRSSGEEHGSGYDSEEEGRLVPTSLFRGDVGEAVCSISGGEDANDQIGASVLPPLSSSEATAFAEEPKSEAKQECSLSESDEVVSEASIRSIRNYQRKVVKSSLSPLISPPSGSIACSDCEQEVKAEFDVVSDPSTLFRGDVGEEVHSQALSVARAVSSPDSPSTCERYAEAKELDNLERGGDIAHDQGSAALSTIPSPNATVPPPLSSSVSAEDRDEVKDVELSQKRLSSFLARIQDGEGIIAVETNLNQVARAAVERIFDPWQPQYKRLTALANDVITVLTCNDKASKNLFLEHSGKADMAASNVIGLGTGVAWGDIAYEAAGKVSDDKKITDLPDGITSFLEGAREAVSLLDTPRAKKLETFVKLWDAEKFQLGNLASLAIMQMALYKLTLEAVTSDKGSTSKLRNNVEALWAKVLPGVDFDAAERLSVILTVVLRPGLNSTDETIFALSCDVLLGTIKILTFKTGTETEHLEIQNAYNDSQSYTADGKIGKSKKDYCSQPKARKRMVTLYFVHYVHDLLVRLKLSQETTGKSFLPRLLITGPDRIRNAFNQSMFDMSKDVSKAQLTKIRDLLKAEKQERSNESRMLLIDSEEQIKSMQNILQIAAKPNDHSN